MSDNTIGSQPQFNPNLTTRFDSSEVGGKEDVKKGGLSEQPGVIQEPDSGKTDALTKPGQVDLSVYPPSGDNENMGQNLGDVLNDFKSSGLKVVNFDALNSQGPNDDSGGSPPPSGDSGGNSTAETGSFTSIFAMLSQLMILTNQEKVVQNQAVSQGEVNQLGTLGTALNDNIEAAQETYKASMISGGMQIFSGLVGLGTGMASANASSEAMSNAWSAGGKGAESLIGGFSQLITAGMTEKASIDSATAGYLSGLANDENTMTNSTSQMDDQTEQFLQGLQQEFQSISQSLATNVQATRPG